MQTILYFGLWAHYPDGSRQRMRNQSNHKKDLKWAIAILVVTVISTLLAIWLLPA